MIKRVVLACALAFVGAWSVEASAKKPSFKRQANSKTKSTADITQQSILANIENQMMILELEDKTGAEYPMMKIALADFYWDLSEIYFRRANSEELEQGLYEAEEAKDKATLNKLKVDQQMHLRKQRKYQEKTVGVYLDVIREFPAAKRLAEIRFYLGFHLYAMGQMDKGRDAYYDLVRNHPNSRYVPDALVNIGDYYFEDNDYEKALQLYQQVEKYPDAGVLAYAAYKQAWTLYNLADYEACLSKMLNVITVAERQHKAGVMGAYDLMEEARSELAYPYSKVGKPQAALRFFKRYAPADYLRITAKLAELYTEQTEYQKSSKLLRTLVREAQTVAKTNKSDQRHLVLSFQRQIVNNAHRGENRRATVAEVKSLIQLLKENKKAPLSKKFKKEERTIESLVAEIANTYQKEFATTRTAQTLDLTQELFEQYLNAFRASKNAYDMSYNNAVLKVQQGRHQAAAEEFERVIAMKPTGKHTDSAAEQTVLAYLKTLGVQNQEVKNEAEEELKRRELDPKEKAFVEAVDRWLRIVDSKGAKPETAENIPPARFAAAKILYDANQFDGAAKRFGRFYREHRQHALWEDAARHVLSSYNLNHDVDNLRRYANTFDKDRRLMMTPLGELVTKTISEFNFQKCFKFEKKSKWSDAAKCFIDYQRADPAAEKAAAAVFNAGVNYFKAKMVEKAMRQQTRLYEEYNTHELAPKALYSIAKIYQETGVYEESASHFERFVESYPNHKLAEGALRYASIFRKTLRHWEEAITNLNTYLKRYPDPERSPRVHLDIIRIHEKNKRFKGVLKAVGQHMKKYKQEPPGIRMQVMVIKGRALAAQGKAKAKKARAAFEATVTYFNTLSDQEVRGLDLKSVSAVAEAHFNLGEFILSKARNIKLKGSKAKLSKSIKDKMTLMAQARKVYEQVISYGHPGWMIAAYTQLGLAFRDLADAVENSPVPKKFEDIPDAAEEYRTMAAEKAKPIRDKAVNSYGRALTIAREKNWFNRYSERAERAIAQLDLTDRTIKEARLRPDRMRANSGLPMFMGGE